ncbi:uncharacterized protein UTRI_03665_B [Ustilago trichophora]|uniref:Uncharacterized protein n=1 Tax=Ustilago trichophora TaxID=86804 RepID=A0A5C3E2R2_9BASI|nr:uncharacterized protein UTRI_03665_B [Ustilago trichophora]
MAGDKAATSATKQRRPLTQLPPALTQLVDDRFDEDQYDQAVELLEQLKAEGIRPSKSLIQELVALSLCSLAPGQLASTSRWTLDHQLHDIAARLLTQPKASKSDRNVMKAASAASDRPSQSAILHASSLLIQYSQAATSHDIAGELTAAAPSEDKCRLLALQILESLPSRRRPLELSRDDSPGTPRRARLHSLKSEDSDHEGSFEISSIERWVRQDLHRAEDVWDLLCDRRFSNPTEAESATLARVSEFWMNDTERRRYLRQLEAESSSHRRLDDRIKEIRLKKSNGGAGLDSSDSETDDVSGEDDLSIGLTIPGRTPKRPAKSKGASKSSYSPAKPAKRARTSRSAAVQRDDEETQHQQVKMTEGAWRTLSILLRLWEQASPKDTTTGSGPSASVDSEPPLLWQFPHSHSARQSGRTVSKPPASKDKTDEIGRALDVVFSFPSILPAYAPAATQSQAASDLFDTVKSADTRGHSRPLTSVTEAELVHRQKVADQKDERNVAGRAQIAARLLESIYDLVRLNYISSVAYIEGVSERIEALHACEIQYLMMPLLIRKPIVVANVLIVHLQEGTRTRPDKKRSPQQVHLRFGGGETISMDAALAYAMPNEKRAITYLRTCSSREPDCDAKAILDFLSLNNLELDSSANISLSLTFPTKLESRKQSTVHMQRQKAVKGGSYPRKSVTDSGHAAAMLTEEMKKGGLAAFAFVRAVQMETRDRINQMKFLLARALVSMYTSTESLQAKQDPDFSANRSASSPKGESDQNDGEKVDSDWASQRATLRLFLARLVKALKHDAAEFGHCVSALETHVSKDSSSRRSNPLSNRSSSKNDKEGPTALPSLEAIAKRCQRCFEATQSLVHATQFLMTAVPRRP